ncbi:MAG: class I SAM-dependent methyltransferase [Actinobacteria bacterium]|nr:class I SAM-dependent methyltransferase [Actinomycetota bacterium]
MFNFSKLHFYESRVKTIKSFHGTAHTGFRNRGQIAPSDDRNVIGTYSELGFMHARELTDALGDTSAFQEIPEINVIDIGCGYGITRAVLTDLKIPFGTYVGMDSNSEMIWFAQEIEDQGMFIDDLSECDEFESPVLVTINHVLGQNTVSKRDIETWVLHLKRICKSGLIVLNIEPEGYGPSTAGRVELDRLLKRAKFPHLTFREWRIEGQVRGNKKAVACWVSFWT